MRVLVTGGRYYADWRRVAQELDELHATEVIQGGALGADQLARRWAQIHGAYLIEYRAEWDRYGRHAGPIRNQKMIDQASPDLVLAFPGGNGTADCVRRAKKAGIPVKEIEE